MSEPEINLQQRFPDMTPISSVPSLGMVNGFGTTVYGHRDDDPATGTYVVTHVFCLLFVPVISLGAYRVASAPGGGWYFLGRVPMSGLARNWNWLLGIGILTAATVIYFQIRARDPEHIAAVKLQQADNLAAGGKVGQAAELYRVVAVGTTSHAPMALEKLGLLLDNSSAESTELARAFQIAVEMHRSGKRIDRLFERGLAQVRVRAEADAEAALLMADALLPLVGEIGQKDAAGELADVRLKALQRKLKDSPNDLDVVSEIALIYEGRRDLETCEKLLAPHAAKLGSREGARILGMIYSHNNKLDEAAVLLIGYTDNRARNLAQADQERKAALKRLIAAESDRLSSGKAPGFDYARYRTSDKKTQDKMTNEYMLKQFLADPAYIKAMDAYHKEMNVVSASLELGMVYLRQGQAIDDPDARKIAMQKAEKAFLSVSSANNESADFADEVKLQLGQVYYWLGRHDDGKKEFDNLLAAHKNDTMVQLRVAHALRDVGSSSEARELAEKAFNTPSDPKLRFLAAGMRANLGDDMDDRIAWMEKTDPDNKSDQASLFHWRGERAIDQGKDEEAVQFLKKSLDLYGSLPESPVTLNNGAIVQLAMFRATGDRANFQRASAMMEKASQQRPGDAILVVNTAENNIAVALWDVIGNSLNQSTLRRSYQNQGLLPYLYNDAAGLQSYRDKIRSNPGITKALKDLERGMLLGPRTPRSYQELIALYGFLRDLNGLRKLDERLAAVELDLGDNNRRERDHQRGKDDDKLRKDLPSNIARVKARLEASRAVGGPTYAVAVNDWISIQSLANFLQGRLSRDDLDSLCRLADDAAEHAPSSGARWSQIQAVTLRAHNDLLLKSTEYAAMARKSERAMNSQLYLIAFGLSRPGKIRDACLANADVQRAMALVKEDSNRMIDAESTWSWAFVSAAFPKDAARIARKIQEGEAYRLKLKLAARINPLSPTTVLDEYWLLQIQGTPAEADAVLATARKAGVILPE